MKRVNILLMPILIFLSAKGAEPSKGISASMVLEQETVKDINALAMAEQMQEEKIKRLDLMILLDKNRTESTLEKAMSQTLGCALSQKAVPIIASTNLVLNCLKTFIDKPEMMADIKREFQQSPMTAYGTLYGKYPNIDIRNYILGCLIDLNDWETYVNKHNPNMMLFMPKSYIAEHATESYDKIKQCGFNSDNLTKVDAQSVANIVNFVAGIVMQPLQQSADRNTVDLLKTMIIPEKKLPQSAKQNKHIWNIFLSGHGGPAEKKGDIAMRLQMSAARESELRQILAGMGNTGQRGPDLRPEALDAAYYQAMKDYYGNLLSGAQSLSNIALVPASAMISDLSFDEFSQFLTFLEKDIYTSYLHYTTCFGGGYNQSFINETLKQINAQFIVSAAGMSEGVTFFVGAGVIKPEKYKSTMVLSAVNFIKFFDCLNALFGDRSKAIDQALQKDPFTTIMQCILPTTGLASSDIANQPTMRIPSVGIFSPIDANKKIKILTNSIAKSHDFENKPIEFLDPRIEAIFLYPKYLQSLLKINSAKIIAASPEQTSESARIAYVLNDVYSVMPIHEFIASCVGPNINIPDITFFFKKAALGYNPNLAADGRFKDLVIRCLKEGNQNRLHIGFIDNNSQLYHYRIVEPFNKDNNLVQTCENMKDILYSKLTEAAAEKNANVDWMKPATDTATSVQRPGSLKKVLVMKKLDSLERAVSPDQIKQEKSWFAKNNKSVEASFNNTLLNRGDELDSVMSEIAQLSDEDLPQQDRENIFNKIRSIRARINEELERMKPEVDTATTVQRPASLKKVLLMKKLDSLERAVSPDQIKEEKSWLAKNNKSVAESFSDTLLNHGDELDYVMSEIAQLSDEDLPPKDRENIFNKNRSIRARINEELERMKTES